MTDALRLETNVKAQLSRILVASMLTFTALGMAACSGGGAKTNIEARSTTTGQELSDLKKAYEQGAISKQEYEKEREKILKRQ
jgi:uncharacterized membrane protein